MSKKIIRLTENDLEKLVKKIVNEQGNMGISEEPIYQEQLNNMKQEFRDKLIVLLNSVENDDNIEYDDKEEFIKECAILLDCLMGLY
jgi:hypothetical protein